MNISEFELKKVYSEASGSTSVVDSNIKMKLNKNGLYEEVIVDSDKELNDLVPFVSPNLNDRITETEIADQLYENIENIDYDERLGYYSSLYVGYVNEGEFRKDASSGGMGTWIFKELFEEDMIDYVLHVKKNENSNDKRLFKYDVSTSIEEIRDGAKTKYYPVEISELMDTVKNTPGRYAVIGIPSFIYSIRLLAKVDEVINERIKYTVGLVCGHQKSAKFAESMAWQVGIEPGNLIDIDFRHKLLDRPASSYAVKMTGRIDGELQTIIKPTSELFGLNWGWGFFKPVASNFTDDVFNETADIVLGDAWLPEYASDSKGNNIVIVRNSDIDQLVKDAIQENRLKMDAVDNETIFASQVSHYRHTHDELAYRLYVKDIENEWRPEKRVRASSNISDTRRKIQDLRKIISEQSHIQYQEAVQRNDFNYFVENMTEYTSEYTELYRSINRKSLLNRVLRMSPKEFTGKVINRLLR
ncbi:Coenzyme F420 hydrogenase/dehydrogenase, beta subunit C-terminal domain [Aerococcus urinaeequi]|uniref:Coenzyme F420 hydrogenase/dehydrogenase, beta subunit C-terminal domain n=1 Tax=Aerococcus urinaeequi TaxID=51665 RepID=A0AA47G9T1_9LACT|nr:Coenzyme F420 hydrogenase/dehydrogenase, beta subunit C-terminal domain [Aerococcus urinaeequi]WAT23969.1 Coenzyme F420 hydrogenase/dehydrogenase, beta subunit C-terminal domain [Aerococcus urinaeequi]